MDATAIVATVPWALLPACGWGLLRNCGRREFSLGENRHEFIAHSASEVMHSSEPLPLELLGVSCGANIEIFLALGHGIVERDCDFPCYGLDRHWHGATSGDTS